MEGMVEMMLDATQHFAQPVTTAAAVSSWSVDNRAAGSSRRVRTPSTQLAGRSSGTATTPPGATSAATVRLISPAPIRRTWAR